MIASLTPSGFFYRFIQFLLVAYVVVYAIWWKSGYQGVSPVDGVIFTKVKGIAHSPNGDKVYDASDLVVPALENNAVFITTRTLVTKQHRDTCPDNSTIGVNNCTSNADCRGNQTTNGYLTGECDNSTKYCVIRGWCPVENPNASHTEYDGIGSWTLYMRSSVTYTTFNETSNNGNKAEEDYNIFNVSYMLDGQNITEVFNAGAIVRIFLDWSCDLNFGNCAPVFSFKRIDNEAGAVNIGYNFRSVVYESNTTSDTETRILTKYYGIRFLLRVSGQGAKFDFFTLVVTVGSAIAIFGGVNLAMDFLLLYLHPQKRHFSKAKKAKLIFEAEQKPLFQDHFVSSDYAPQD